MAASLEGSPWPWISFKSWGCQATPPADRLGSAYVRTSSHSVTFLGEGGHGGLVSNSCARRRRITHVLACRDSPPSAPLSTPQRKKTGKEVESTTLSESLQNFRAFIASRHLPPPYELNSADMATNASSRARSASSVSSLREKAKWAGSYQPSAEENGIQSGCAPTRAGRSNDGDFRQSPLSFLFSPLPWANGSDTRRAEARGEPLADCSLTALKDGGDQRTRGGFELSFQHFDEDRIHEDLPGGCRNTSEDSAGTDVDCENAGADDRAENGSETRDGVNAWPTVKNDRLSPSLSPNGALHETVLRAGMELRPLDKDGCAKDDSSIPKVDSARKQEALRRLPAQTDLVRKKSHTRPQSSSTKSETLKMMEHLTSVAHARELELADISRQLEEARVILSLFRAKSKAELMHTNQASAEQNVRLQTAKEAFSKLRQVHLEWWGEASRVEVSGAFNGWQHFLLLEPHVSSEIPKPGGGRGPMMWGTFLFLYPGVFEIKFIVDGVWQVDHRREVVVRDSIQNNLLRVE